MKYVPVVLQASPHIEQYGEGLQDWFQFGQYIAQATLGFLILFSIAAYVFRRF